MDNDNPIQSMPNEKQLKLPELRNGISFAFNDYDMDGKPQWVIHDSGRNKFFMIGLQEYEILKRWSLGRADLVIEAVNRETTLNIELSDIENFTKFLASHYLIKQTGYQIYQRAKEQKLFKNDNFLRWIIDYYLFFKIPLFHPDHFLTKTKILGQWLFSRTMFYIMVVLAVIALYQLNTKWDEFTHTFPTIFSWQGLFFYFIAYSICKLLHELGHAYQCKLYGVPVPSLGIAFLVFWPVLYTDTTLSWSLKSNQRMRIALAGILVETYITIIAALIWSNVHNQVIQTICYVTITINWMASLLINVSPFMRFDGYYVLADYLKIPNLQPRAFALARWQIRHWLFHWPDPPPERFSPQMHRFLVAYSFVTWIYRLVLYFGIALLVYHFFIKLVGIILFSIELFYFILGPIIREIQTWIYHKEKFSFNLRTKVTLFLGIFLSLVFFLPLNESIKLPATLSYKHEFLIAPEDGILETKPPLIGSTIKANQPIVKMTSPELNHQLEQSQLEYKKMVEELRRASINSYYSNQKNILSSNISEEQAKYSKLYNQYKKMTIEVPFNGIMVDVAPDLEPGNAIPKGAWIGDVISPTEVEVEAFVSQIDVNNLRPGLTGHFYPADISEPIIAVKVKSIEIVNSSKLNCRYSTELKQDKNENAVVETPCYHISELGGDIASLLTEEAEYVPVDSIFRVTLITQKPVTISHIQRGTVVVKTEPVSYADKVFYNFKTIFIKQSGF